MKEITLLMEKADNTIRSAELLLREQYFDNSVSRSYYAMFYSAEAVLLTKDLKFSSHKSVLTLFGEHFVKTGIFIPELGRRLNEAFKSRLIGDYSFTSQIDETIATEILNRAKEFIEKIKDYLINKDYIEKL